MKYFTISELTRSNTAILKKIDNSPSPAVEKCLTALIRNVLDPLRQAWGKPVQVNSGYRCTALNRAVGGAASSQHLKGEAADITTGSREGNKKLFDLAQELRLPFDQLIDEKGYQWLHISYREAGNRNQVLHL